MQINKECLRMHGIERSVVSAYPPQRNGSAKCTNMMVKSSFAILEKEHRKDWDHYLEEVAFLIRTQKQATTKYTPFFLMFGRYHRTPMEVNDE